MAKEVSVGAEGPGQFKRGRITFVPDLSRQISTLEWCCACRKTFGRNCGRWKLALLTKTRLRHQMAWWKRAVFSCIFYCKDQCEKRKRTVAYHSKICAVRFVDLYGIIKMYSHFPAVHSVWCKDVNGAILPWVDFCESCQERYHYTDFWACWESMCWSTLGRMVISWLAGPVRSCTFW